MKTRITNLCIIFCFIQLITIDSLASTVHSALRWYGGNNISYEVHSTIENSFQIHGMFVYSYNHHILSISFIL